MFLTRPGFREWMPKFAGYEDCTAWRAVELPVGLPWFLMHVQAARTSPETFSVSYLLSRVNELEQFLAALGADDRTVALHAIYPAAYTGLTSWSMTELEELWQASVHQEGRDWPGWILKTSQGLQLFEPRTSYEPENVQFERLLYRREPRRSATT